VGGEHLRSQIAWAQAALTRLDSDRARPRSGGATEYLARFVRRARRRLPTQSRHSRGNYFRSVASLDVNPEVSGMFVDRGIGGRLYYERADGTVYWQRLELRLAARREVGPFQ